MLREMSWREFKDWQTFEALEPFEEQRMDYRFASVTASIINSTPRKSRRVVRPKDFLIQWGDERSSKPVQTWQEQKMIAKGIAALFNSENDKKKARPGRAPK
jgi:hypothetical protein